MATEARTNGILVELLSKRIGDSGEAER